MSAPNQPGERERETTRDRQWDHGLSPNSRALLYLFVALAGVLVLTMLYRGWVVLSDELRASRAAAQELLLTPPTSMLLGRSSGNLSAPGIDPAAGIPPVGMLATHSPALSATFESFYYLHGGERVLGRPLGPPQSAGGREIQWLERARLEHWPEHARTPYEVQLGRLGAEFTEGRAFAQQTYFVSAPGLRYFPETGHAAGGLFLAFWEQNGGIETFGLPISEAFDEVLPDGMAYRVQYFERARMEYHPQYAGTPFEVQLGRLGAALLSNEGRPTTIQPVPTAVPMP